MQLLSEPQHDGRAAETHSVDRWAGNTSRNAAEDNGFEFICSAVEHLAGARRFKMWAEAGGQRAGILVGDEHPETSHSVRIKHPPAPAPIPDGDYCACPASIDEAVLHGAAFLLAIRQLMRSAQPGSTAEIRW
jgi:hypothetical protein